MQTRILSARKVLTALAKRYNNQAAFAAWYKRCDHDEYKVYVVAAAAMQDVISELFENGKDYIVKPVSNAINGVEYEWRKIEVL